MTVNPTSFQTSVDSTASGEGGARTHARQTLLLCARRVLLGVIVESDRALGANSNLLRKNLCFTGFSLLLSFRVPWTQRLSDHGLVGYRVVHVGRQACRKKTLAMYMPHVGLSS